MTSEAQIGTLCDELLASYPPDETSAREFLAAQFDHGLAWVHFPVGLGGLGASPALQGVVDDRLWRAGAPSPFNINPIGYGMAAATVVTHGSIDQQKRYIRPLFTGEEVWCQLFSEPGAGSDVAGLATRAVRDGDEWIINGQKVWTTLGHVARWGLLVARSDVDAAKHKGMTYFVLDMQAPGVEVRPLRQMTGEAEFNEVYLTDVRVPDAERLGDVGDGWRVILTTLMNERVSVGAQAATGTVDELMSVWSEYGDDSDRAARDELMKLWVRSEVNRLTNLRAKEAQEEGNPGPEGSVAKLVMAELNKDLFSFAVNVMGPHGQLYGSYEMTRPDDVGLTGRSVPQMFLRARANSIEGGTTEVMRNILAERVLGLPGDVRVDKDVPWSEVARS